MKPRPVITGTRTFRGFGKCIYCGSTDSLTREHIIPYGLHGIYIISDGSCSACATITGAFDGHCASKLYGLVRGAFDLPSRRKGQKKNRNTLKALAIYADRSEEQEFHISQLPLLPV